MKSQIVFDDFQKIDIRIGTIITAQVNKEARVPAYVLEIDFGNGIGLKKSSAQITDYYSLDDLVGKQIMAVINFPPRQVARTMSEVLVLGALEPDGKVVLLSTDQKVENGLEIG